MRLSLEAWVLLATAFPDWYCGYFWIFWWRSLSSFLFLMELSLFLMLVWFLTSWLGLDNSWSSFFCWHFFWRLKPYLSRLSLISVVNISESFDGDSGVPSFFLWNFLVVTLCLLFFILSYSLLKPLASNVYFCMMLKHVKNSLSLEKEVCNLRVFASCFMW